MEIKYDHMKSPEHHPHHQPTKSTNDNLPLKKRKKGKKKKKNPN